MTACLITAILLTTAVTKLSGRDITFCGERIPIEESFVAQRLMGVISKQIPTVNMIRLRQQKTDYFPVIEAYLNRFGLPQDFKYLPIVESGFMNVSSQVGARGFWQLMPATARQYGLVTEDMGLGYDDRDNIYKSTEAACRKLVDDYNEIVRRFKMSSWVLTAAGYNWGNGNIQRRIRSQGANYFTMDLNPETAVYVYKIIAVKELFEYPELYLRNLGGNVFNVQAAPPKTQAEKGVEKELEEKFGNLSIQMERDTIKAKQHVTQKSTGVTFISARIKGNYKKFRDGDPIAIVLGADLSTPYSFARKGETLKGTGWLIDGRINVGFEEFGHSVLFDLGDRKGIDPAALTDKRLVSVRYEFEAEE